MKYSLKDIQRRKKLVQELAERILALRKNDTIGSIYRRCTPGSDGVVHTVLSVSTASGRFASAASPIFPHSTNLQNIPNASAALDEAYRVREAFIAPPGYVLVEGDYKSAESVCVAAYSGDEKYLQDLLSGLDTHSAHAELFFGEVWHDSPPQKRKLLRAIAKAVTYASYYAASVPTIARTVNQEFDRLGILLTEKEVAEIHSILLSIHPLQFWWASVDEELNRNRGVLRNALGFRRVFHETDNRHARLKDALSFLAQSTVAVLMQRALRYAHDISTDDCYVDFQLHDSLRFAARPEAVEGLLTKMTPYLEQRFEVRGLTVYIPVEWKVGLNWQSMTPITTQTVGEALHALLDRQGAS